MHEGLNVIYFNLSVILISYSMLLKHVFYSGSDNLLTILSQVSHRKSEFARGSTDDFSIRPGNQG